LALDSKLITGDECEALLDSVSERNLTSHTYNEETAERIQQHIPFYYGTMKAIIDRLKIDDTKN
jgi:glucan phosphorylase